MRNRTLFVILVCLFALVGLRAVGADKLAPPASEFRALWVDGFNAGIRTPQEAEQLVADAQRGHFNTLIVQVRRRGDSLYLKSPEPYVEGVPYDPNFDPLANIIELAHRAGIEVHAWINATPIWRDQPPPLDPRHAFNLHGPAASGPDLWLTAAQNGAIKFPTGYSLDPGHPAVAEYLVSLYVNVVRNYAVDAIHFDYIRYPETDGRMPRGADVGYNPVSLERFRKATARTGTPAPDDPQWIEWRRRQVTQLVRRVYLEAKSVNPRIKVSAAVIAWGRPPVSEQDFENVAPMQRIFQDWHGWLKEGILDIAVPMNYAAESNPQVRDWFNGWIEWEKQHRHGRQIAVGIGAYQNAPEQVLAQIGRVRQPARKNRADGMSLYSYSGLSRRTPPPEAQAAVAPVAATPAPATPLGSPDRLAYLISGVAPLPAAFVDPAPLPRLSWIEAPTRGYVVGTARAAGSALDGGTVLIRKTGLFARTLRVTSDGNGYFGFTNLKPGRYRVRIQQAGKKLKPVTVEVAAGKVARAEIVAE